MSNPLYNMMNNQNNNNLVAQFQKFRNTFKGDPKQMVQNMLNNGQVSQDQVVPSLKLSRPILRKALLIVVHICSKIACRCLVTLMISHHPCKKCHCSAPLVSVRDTHVGRCINLPIEDFQEKTALKGVY